MGRSKETLEWGQAEDVVWPLSMAGWSRKAPILAWAPLTEGSFKTTMSVLFETSLGDIVINLEVNSCPKTCENFLRLCKVYHYNLNAFFNGELVSGISYSGHFADELLQYPKISSLKLVILLRQEQVVNLFGQLSPMTPLLPTHHPLHATSPPEILPKLKHTHKGTVSMAVAPALENHKGGCGSQFFITLGENIDYLYGKHAVFGRMKSLWITKGGRLKMFE